MKQLSLSYTLCCLTVVSALQHTALEAWGWNSENTSSSQSSKRVQDSSNLMQKYHNLSRCVTDSGELSVDPLNKTVIEQIVDQIRNDRDFASAMMFCAAQRGDMEMLRFIFVQRPDVNINVHDSFGNTALFKAVGSGNADIVAFLVSKKADEINEPNAKNREGQTLLTLALWGSNPVPTQIAILKDLLRIPGIDVNARGMGEFTPLVLAIAAGNIDAVNVLVESPGININGDVADLLTPLEAALRQAPADKRDEIIAILKDHGATY